MLRIVNKFYNWFLSPDRHLTHALRKMLGIVPHNLHNFKLAFQHRSLFPDLAENNERLEFLGDAVLDLIVTEYLFQRYPLKDEGFITRMRSKIVNRKYLNRLGHLLGIEELMIYNKSSINIKSGYHSLPGNTLEALIGAVYLDIGYEKTRNIVFHRMLKPHTNLNELESTIFDYKSRVIEWSQKNGKSIEFRMLGETTTADNRSKFMMGIYVNDELLAQADGFSKKQAEQRASKIVVGEMELA